MVTAAAYWPSLGNGFLNYDDDLYVTANRHVTEGLTLENVGWAFSTSHALNWHPMTWLSHMLVAQLFGVQPFWHHLHSPLLHLANVALLMMLVYRMTRQFWPSAAVAGLFALHPMHVESVAWVSERKDVLSGCFALLALHAYVSYVHDRRWFNYALLLCLYALGLMSKPMLVTLPCLMLLLDYWPLRRISEVRIGWLLLEKIPFVAMAAASSIITVVAQGDAVMGPQILPLHLRLINALVSYLRYLGKWVWPFDLAAIYPYYESSSAMVVAAAIIVIAISIYCIFQRQKRPALIIGWLWFLGTLMPVIGVVQIGSEAMADRYAYIPFIGLDIAVVWLLAEIVRRRWIAPKIAIAAASVVGVLLAAATWRQSLYWKDDLTLFSHALDVTAGNYRAQWIVGMALQRQGQMHQAEMHFRQSLQIQPNFSGAHNSLGVALARRREFVQAETHFRQALEQPPNNADFHYNFARALLAERRIEDAIGELTQALRLDPKHSRAHGLFGTALFHQGKYEPAAEHLRQGVQQSPNNPVTQTCLAISLHKLGRTAEAVIHYTAALRMQPNDVSVLIPLAWIKATDPDALLRDGTQAVQLAERARDLTHSSDAGVIDVLAAAYAEAGRFTEAVTAQQSALDMVRQAAAPTVADEFARRLTLYKAKQAFRQAR